MYITAPTYAAGHDVSHHLKFNLFLCIGSAGVLQDVTPEFIGAPQLQNDERRCSMTAQCAIHTYPMSL